MMTQSFFKNLVTGLLGLCLALTVPLSAEAKAHKVSGLPVADIKVVGEGHPTYTFKVEIADDESERATGLMYRRDLPRMEGMLFEFEEEAPRSFWMRNTYLPLDIIFIDTGGKIVSIQKQAKPFDETPLNSGVPAKAALEVIGGLSDRLKIRPGDRIEYGFFKAH